MAASSESLPSPEITSTRASTTYPAGGAAKTTSGECSTDACIAGKGAVCVALGCPGPRDSGGAGIFGAVLSPHPAAASASVTVTTPPHPTHARTCRPMNHLAPLPDEHRPQRRKTAAGLVSTPG